MRLGPEWVFLIGAGGALLALCPRPSLLAQGPDVADAQRLAVSVPFIGCASSGQTGTLEAPKGTTKPVAIGSRDAQAFAYYESADGIGLLAPRGWHCAGASGSGGAVLFLSPIPVRETPSGWDGIEGTAIEVNRISGENSGRYDIAAVIARVFPIYRAIAARVMEDFDFPLPSGPYPEDTLTYRSKRAVEYTTPAQTEGLGNFDSYIGKSGLPIKGIAILVGDPPRLSLSGEQPSLILLSVRLPPDLARLTPAIIRYVERESLTK